jgi:diadenylate cyclase
VLSLALAVVAWAVVTRVQAETLERTFTVPVTYRNVPDEWLLDQPDPESVRVTLTGSAQGFRRLDPNALTAAIDTSQVHEGNQEIVIDPAALELPLDVSVQRVEPRTATIVAHQTAQIELPIKPQIAGRVPRGMTLEALRASPDQVTVTVRASERHRYHALKTEAVNLSELERTTTVTRRVLLPEGVNAEQGFSLTVEVTAVLTPVSTPRTAPSAALPQP